MKIIEAEELADHNKKGRVILEHDSIEAKKYDVLVFSVPGYSDNYNYTAYFDVRTHARYKNHVPKGYYKFNLFFSDKIQFDYKPSNKDILKEMI